VLFLGTGIDVFAENNQPDTIVNTDNRQIDGAVETEHDPKASQIANLNDLDYGGSRTTPAGVVFKTVPLDFTIPEIPQAEYDPETDELVIYDEGGTPHVVPVPTNDGKSVFPMMVEDAQGNKYQVDLPEGSESTGDGRKDANSKTPTIEQYAESSGENEIQEHKSKIDKDDISLYITVDYSKGKKYQVLNCENNETIILSPGKYKFSAVRNYVEVQESQEKESLSRMDIVVKSIDDLNIAKLSTDKTRYEIDKEDFKANPYIWRIGNDRPVEGKNELEYEFNTQGNYVIEVQTRTLEELRTAKVSQSASGSDKVELGGYLNMLGIAKNFKLNILVLDPKPVYFTRGDDYKGEYGFDNYEKIELQDKYEKLKIENVIGQYCIPYLSITPGQRCNILATVTLTKDDVKNINSKSKEPAYTFSADAPIVITPKMPEKWAEGPNKIALSINCPTSFGYNAQVPKHITVADLNSNIVGEMNVYCSIIDKQEDINLVKVYLGDSRQLNNAKSPETLMDEVLQFANERAYNQTFSGFNKGNIGEIMITEQEIDDYLKSINKGRSDMFNEKGEIRDRGSYVHYELDMVNDIIKNDSRFSGWDKTLKTIVVIANRNYEESGGARTNGYSIIKQCVILYSGASDYSTYVHELGHIFGLKHSFEGEYRTPQGSTRNFMDYAPATDMFWQWQWDEIRKNIGINNANKKN